MYVLDNYYTLTELAKLAQSMIVTKLFYPNAMLIRRPFYLRGKPRISFGEGFTTGYNCRIETFGAKDDLKKKLVIGKNCHIGDNVHIAAAEHVEIGDDCLFASRIFISDLNHGSYSGDGQSSPSMPPNDRPLQASRVVIGDRVWLGENVSVLGGASIGDGCIIGTGAVVTGDIPANSIAVGAPARVIKTYDEKTRKWVKA